MNLVSGNDGAGITIVGGSSNIVRANYVGTDTVDVAQMLSGGGAGATGSILYWQGT